MNKNCECPTHGYCPRHRVRKGPRQYELCKGINCDVQTNAKYWNLWEKGLAPGQDHTPVPEVKEISVTLSDGRVIDMSTAKGGCCGGGQAPPAKPPAPIPADLDAKIAAKFPEAITKSTPIEKRKGIIKRARKFIANVFDFKETMKAWGEDDRKPSSDHEHDERAKICAACPMKTLLSRCKVCDCFLPAKVAMRVSFCPTGKWFVEQPVRPVGQRNLIYFVAPLLTNMPSWQKNLAMLLKRIELFDGKRVICVAQGKGCAKLSAVQAFFEGIRIDEWQTITNNKKIREVAAHIDLLESVKDTPGVTFYAHTKGVTRGPNPAVKYWVEASYEVNLDDWSSVERALSQYSMCGAFKHYGMFSLPNNFRWHYSGTFYWFRNDDVFSRNWKKVDRTFIGAEAWPAFMFKSTETACIAFDDIRNAYSIEEWDSTLLNKWREWRDSRGIIV